MNRTKTLLTFPAGVVAVVALLCLSILVLGGCAEPTAVVVVPPTATVYSPPPTEAPPPPAEATPAALDFPLAAHTQVEVEVASDQTCVDCHTDEETLKALAEEEEVVEELSEGEG